MPMPNHCVECDKPLSKDSVGIECHVCREKEDHTKICDGCGEANCNGSCMAPVDEEPMTNCCNAHFTYPGFPDSDLCSKCFEHADIQEEEDSDDYYKDMQEDR